ncbi:antibiotic biosynthesis monooxygenase [Prauserella sp. ASG 168]|uniref:Antibiotic biosynthesis monooxygenase n=2 Tax=Prauserella cavernicola TaxID=2800127 RepID=A0A934QLZ5_9PSEU|nr:antibiotic biosynthesis monooxygenase [Prauserella cavernicola]
MVTEIAHLRVTTGDELAFESAVAEAAPLFRAAPGCRAIRLTRSIEVPRLYRLLVEWETIEHHTVSFRESEAFSRWRELVSPYFAAPPEVEHVVDVLRP